MPSPVKEIALRLESECDIVNTQSLLSIIRPNWPKEKLCFKVFNEGISNTLFAIYLDTPLTPDNTVLVRIFGYQTELYIDRDREALYMWILNQFGFTSQVFAKFTNGICYGYIPGFTPSCEMLTKPQYFKMVAEKLAALHCLPVSEFAKKHFSGTELVPDTKPCVMHYLTKFIGLLPECFSSKLSMNCAGDGSVMADCQLNYLSKEYLEGEVKFLRKLLSNAKSPVAFCHNDLLFGNIVFSPNEDSVHFIDFEYCGYNHVCYDIANHFCEYAGMSNPDYSKIPSNEMQREWVRVYLSAYQRLCTKHTTKTSESHANKVCINAAEVDKWLEEIRHFTLASHLYWGIWGMVQAFRSKIAFDYTGYAFARLREYKRLKSQLCN
uniref:ethanolamine kinase n=1 Tax=Mesocestoides corti TaxID=53468 RepID=A0A5K3F447_MESCO